MNDQTDRQTDRIRLAAPVRWAGGKARLVNDILPFLGEHVCYVEPFCGGASLFWSKPKSNSGQEVLNDLDGELVNFCRVLHRRGRRLAAEVGSMPYSRAEFNLLLRSEPASDFARAVKFWYCNRVCFGGKRTDPVFGTSSSACSLVVLPERVLASLDGLIERLRHVILESLPALECIARYDRPHTLFYVDPPYIGLANCYSTPFAECDHRALAAALRRIDGRFLLSLNDTPLTAELYAGLPTRRLRSSLFTIGGITRHGGNRFKVSVELLFSNRPMIAAR